MKKTLLVTLADQTYVDQAKQLFSSAYWNGGWKGDYMLLAHNIRKEDLTWFTSRGILVKECRSIFSGKLSSAYPAMVTNKFYLFTEEFKKWDNVVFLDADIIVRYSIDALTRCTGFNALPEPHNSLLKDQFIDAARDNNPKFKKLITTFDCNTLAFNTGVMAFSTDIIFSDSFTRLEALFQEYQPICRFGEQPIINLFLYKQWKKIGYLYNVIAPMTIERYHIPPEYIDGRILHFCGPGKPWIPVSLFYKEWVINLKKSEGIHVSQGARENGHPWPVVKRLKYVLYLSITKAVVDAFLFVDKKIGEVGIVLSKHYPSIYKQFKRNSDTTVKLISSDQRIDAILLKYSSRINDFFYIYVASNSENTSDSFSSHASEQGWKGDHVGFDQYHFDTVVSKHNIEKVDLLYINDEKNVYEQIKCTPSGNVHLRPAMILYGHTHLDGNKKLECAEQLKSNGYTLLETPHDTLAYLSFL